MADRKFNVEGATLESGTEESTATYKVINEADLEVKSKEKDGADAKLLERSSSTPKVVSTVVMADAKYVVGDQRNGDAKVELDAQKTFTGLTKEELMKYANDPFWVRLRWTMFALFWLAWLSMLVGAIVIIVQAPKCPAPEPRKWYEAGPLAEVERIGDVDKLLGGLQERKVQGLMLPKDLTEPDTYKVYDSYKPTEGFTLLAKKAKEYGVKLIMDLNPLERSTATQWFIKSEERDPEFDSYFVWGKPKAIIGNAPVPPNNWTSLKDESAWAWSDKRKEFYLNQIGSANMADLNMTNPDVQQHFTDVLKFWIKEGVSGFRLLNGRHLTVDPELRDESVNHDDIAPVVNTYNFLKHDKTRDLPATFDLIAMWKKVVGVDGLLTIAETVPASIISSNKIDIPNGGVIDLMASPDKVLSSFKLVAIGGFVNGWPTLQYTTEPGLESEALIVSMLLPAAPQLTSAQLGLDQEGDWQDHAVYTHLKELRSQATITHGNTTLNVIGSDSGKMFAYTRQKAGTSAYLVVWNPNSFEVSANVSTIPRVSDTLEVELLSRNYKGPDIKNVEKIVTLTPKSAILFSFAPVVTE